jgi:FtsH-binding integral membrane protein
MEKGNPRFTKETYVLFVAAMIAVGSTAYAISVALPSTNLATNSPLQEAHADHSPNAEALMLQRR